MSRSRQQDGRRKSRHEDPALNLLSELESHVGALCRQPSGRTLDTYATDDNMSTCSVDEADFQPLQDQLMTLDAADSDAESVDSEQENALKHAGLYTAEEIALVFRDKLIRLQSLYIDQFKRLHHRLREKRRHYLHTMRRTFPMPSAETDRIDPKCEADQRKLRALNRYYRRFGKEALLVRQCKERRIAFSEGSAYKPAAAAVSSPCKHVGDACSAPALPLSKYCLQHIQDDSRQVLYTRCEFPSGICKQIVPAIFTEPRCHLHTKLQSLSYRYSSCEHDSSKEEQQPVDIVSVSNIRDNLTSTS